MNIVDRVKKICLSPATEWPVIATENTPAASLVTGYILPLAAIGAVAGFVGTVFIGVSLPFVGTYRTPIVAGVVSAVLGLVLSVVMCYVLAAVVNALAPNFGGQKDSAQAFKVVVYAYTPVWVAGVLQILPVLGMLGILAVLYGIYLLYLGLPRLMKCPEDKSIVYTIVVVVVGIVISLVLFAIVAAVVGTGALMSGAMRPQAGLDPNSALGRLGQAMEQSAAKMDEAQRSGDPAQQAAAAMEGLGALLGGGRRVDPLQLDQLEPFVPATFANLAQTDKQSERTGLASLMVARIEATYGDGAGNNAELEIVDTGGASGIMGLASWAGLRGEQRTSDGTERTYQEGGRLMHEKSSNSGGMNEFGIVIGERFMVTARSRALNLAALKSAVGSLDLAKLEGMKDVGVSR
ncbi:MAG TPA: Yip1 family protein [Vicinamibacterales bacterium]|nr:Yip1 family protein [Vicinamibacterales bacterium]